MGVLTGSVTAEEVVTLDVEHVLVEILHDDARYIYNTQYQLLSLENNNNTRKATTVEPTLSRLAGEAIDLRSISIQFLDPHHDVVLFFEAPILYTHVPD